MINSFLELLGLFYQTGNLGQMEAVARSLLHTIPGDLVALQFLGLALHKMGRTRDAYAIFSKAAAVRWSGAWLADRSGAIESASAALYRAATRPGSRLATAWPQVAQVVAQYGFRDLAGRAMRAARRASAPEGSPRSA